MSKVNTGQASSTLIPKYIGSDFDKVVAVADNIEQVVIVSNNTEDVGTVADNINYVKEVAEDLHGMPVTMYTGENPPVLNPMPEGVMWYCTTDGRTYVWYTDADSGQWVESAPQSAMKDEATNIFFHATPSNVNAAYRNATLFSTPAPEAEISVAHNALNTPVVQAQFIREEALWVDVSVTGAQGIVTLMGYSSGNSQLKAEIITWKSGAEGTSLGASQWVTLPSQPSVVSLPVTLANIDVLDAGDSYVVRLTSQMNAGGSAVSTILVDGNTSSRFGIIFNTNLIGLNDGIRDGVTTSAPTENAVYDALQLKADKTEVSDALQLKVGKSQLVQSGNLTSTANWANVPAYSDSELGGSGGPLNAQAKALTARSELLLTDVREALRRSYAEAGYNLVDGSFEVGGVLVNTNDVLLQESTGRAFSGPAGPVDAGTNPASGGFVDASGLLPGCGVVRDGKFSLRDFVSLADFIPAHADKNYLADADFARALSYASSKNITNILLPSNMTFKLTKTALNKNTAQNLRLYCDRPAVYNENSGGTIWTDSDRVFDVGIDDGNPDTTGFTSSVVLENLQLGRTPTAPITSDTSDVAVNVVNTAQFTMKGCRTFGFKQGGVRLEGGLVIVKHIDNESYGLTGKDAATGYGSGIVMGQKYWGTFDLEIVRPHIFQYMHAITFGRGRKFKVAHPTFENLRSSCYNFFGAEEIYSLSIDNTYSELVREFTLRSDTFTGLIYSLSITNCEIHECPGFSPRLSNMDRSRVLRFHESGNVFADASMDAQLGITTSGRLIESKWFPKGTIMEDPVYMNDLHRMTTSLKRKEMLKSGGTFSSISGGYPVEWVAVRASAAWSIFSAPTNNGHSLQSGGGDWIHAQKTIAKDPVAKLYAIAFTHVGELTININGGIVHQGTAVGLKTVIVRFQSTTSASLVIQIGPISDINNKVTISEMRLWEVGDADYTEVGTTSGLLGDAIKSVMSNGVF